MTGCAASTLKKLPETAVPVTVRARLSSSAGHGQAPSVLHAGDAVEGVGRLGPLRELAVRERARRWHRPAASS